MQSTKALFIVLAVLVPALQQLMTVTQGKFEINYASDIIVQCIMCINSLYAAATCEFIHLNW